MAEGRVHTVYTYVVYVTEVCAYHPSTFRSYPIGRPCVVLVTRWAPREGSFEFLHFHGTVISSELRGCMHESFPTENNGVY